MYLDKLKSWTVNSPYRSVRWGSYAVITVAGFIVLPFLVLGYSGYWLKSKESWPWSVRALLVSILALILPVVGFAWTAAFFTGPNASDSDNQNVAQVTSQDKRENIEDSEDSVGEITTTTSSTIAANVEGEANNPNSPTSNSTTTQKETSTSTQQEYSSEGDSSTTSNSSLAENDEDKNTSSAEADVSDSGAISAGNEDGTVQQHQETKESQPSIETESSTRTQATVTRIIDGDTVEVYLNGEELETVRLIGIDTPETQHPSKPVQCFGEKASQKAQEELGGKRITLEYDSTQGRRGTYGRLLAYIHLPDGTNFNKQMIEEGYAYEYTYNTPYKYQDAFKEAERSARLNNRGLWAPDTCDGERTAANSTEQETMDNGEEEGDADSSETEDNDESDSDEQSESNVDGYWYASGYHTAEYYYHESCEGWEGLSERYLQKYETEQKTREDNPDYELHPDCEPE